jgi:hypothetical protein
MLFFNSLGVGPIGLNVCNEIREGVLSHLFLNKCLFYLMDSEFRFHNAKVMLEIQQISHTEERLYMRGPQFSLLAIKGLGLLISQRYMPGLSKTLVFGEIFKRLPLNYFFSFLEEEMEKLTLQTNCS